MTRVVDGDADNRNDLDDDDSDPDGAEYFGDNNDGDLTDQGHQVVDSACRG